MNMSERNPIDRSYEKLVDAGRAGIRTRPNWPWARELFSESTDGRRFAAITRAGCVTCRFSGCKELAFTESRFGPVCEVHADAALVR